MIIDGKKISKDLIEKVKDEVSKIKKQINDFKNKQNKTPKLSVILIGNYAPSEIYVKNKEKFAKEAGINSEVIRYPKEISEKEVLKKIDELNDNSKISGILVQLPLPPHINKEKIINAIKPSKDVDGFHPMNVGGLASGSKSIVPCTPLGCLFLIKSV